MLTLVEVRTSQGSLLSLPLQGGTSGLLVESIEGLDPVKATLVSSSFARMDGQQYQSSRREARNIKIRLDLEPDYVLEIPRDLRRRLYGFFMPKSEITLKFYMSSGMTVDIVGRVESFETALFTKEPAVDISIMCFNPDFFDPIPQVIAGNTTAATTETPITCDCTVETGIIFTLNVNRSLSEFTFYHRPPDGMLHSLDFAAALVAGDVLTINTSPGSKSVTLLRSGVTTSALYALSPYSDWIEFQPGVNNIRVYAVGAAIPYTIEYTHKFGGL